MYEFIRTLLNDYGDRLHAEDLEIFAYEMEPPPSGKGSIDPALRDEFEKIAPDVISDLRGALLVALEFIESELVALRKIPEALLVVADLRAAMNADRPAVAPVAKAIKLLDLVLE